MEIREDLKKVVETLKTERDELKLKIHLGSMEVRKEFEDSEEKWRHVMDKASDMTNKGKATSEELLSKVKVVGEELQETYKRISKRLSE